MVSLLFLLPGLSPPPTLCEPGEQVVMSCVLDEPGARILSVCASRSFNDPEPWVQLRLGLPGRLELNLPDAKAGSISRWRFSRYTAPQVTYLALSMEQGGRKYVAFDDENNGVSARGLRTSVEGREPVESNCRPLVQGTLFSLEDVVPSSR